MPNTTSAMNLILRNMVKEYNQIEAMKAENERREPVLLPHISAHILRHTACTRLAETGLEPKVLQYIMGHSDIGMTMDVYTHLDFTKIQEKIQSAEEKIKIG